MSRYKRTRSETGFYHAVVKGDGGRVIFEGDQNRTKYLELLARAMDEHAVRLHAYCLMSNHVHLLVQEHDGNLSAFMKSLDESYARYFAWFTKRVGHVFQGRFWSEPVDTDERFLATLRYIHANPEPALICRAEDYPWSSYHAYTTKPATKTKRGAVPVETTLGISLLGNEDGFVKFSKSGGSYPKPFPESKLNGHLSADELVNTAINLLGHDVLNGLPAMKPLERTPHLVRLSQAGFKCNEIARVSGIGQASVSRALAISSSGTHTSYDVCVPDDD